MMMIYILSTLLRARIMTQTAFPIIRTLTTIMTALQTKQMHALLTHWVQLIATETGLAITEMTFQTTLTKPPTRIRTV